MEKFTISAAQAHSKEHGIAKTIAHVRDHAEDTKDLNAFIELFDTTEQIAAAEELLENGKETPLTGVPIAIKDNILIKGHIATAGSHVLKDYVGVYNATVIDRLNAAGAIIVGRTNMDEFAMGSSTESSCYGPTKNPIDPTRVPGGSSGGSAAVVGAGIVPISLGSDTGGSIRQPAALCGIVGFKPSYGAVSRYGLMALASSLDQIGPFAHTVSDTRTLFDVIAGHDPMDSTSRTDMTTGNKPGKRLGVPRKFVSMDGVDADVRANFEATLQQLATAGYEIVDVDLPYLKYSLPAYYIIMPAEASSNLARYDGIRYALSVEGDTLMDVYKKTRGQGFGKEVQRRVLLGTYVLSAGYYDAYYNKALAVRDVIARDFAAAYTNVDAILTPTTPAPAFKIGEKTNDPLKMYLEDIFTVSANIAGIPGISLPSGVVTRDGVALPVGLQILGADGNDHALLALAEQIEQVIQ